MATRLRFENLRLTSSTATSLGYFTDLLHREVDGATLSSYIMELVHTATSWSYFMELLRRATLWSYFHGSRSWSYFMEQLH